MVKMLLAAGLAALASVASAQNFPTKPIALYVPFAAGGPTDTVARGLAQASVEIGEIADAERHHGAVERGVGERQAEGVGDDGRSARRLVAAQGEHRHHEVGADHAAAKSGGVGQLGREVHGAGAEIQILTRGRALPTEGAHGSAPPAAPRRTPFSRSCWRLSARKRASSVPPPDC